MFGLSFGEILIILVVALLVLGPERLPKVARTVGKGMRELRRATGDFREVVESEFYLDDDEASRHKPRIAAAASVAKGAADAAPTKSSERAEGSQESQVEAGESQVGSRTEVAGAAPAGTQPIASEAPSAPQGESQAEPSARAALAVEESESPESEEELPTIRPPADGPVARGTKA